LNRLPLIASPLLVLAQDGFPDPVAHLGRSDLFPLALAVDVARPVPVGEDRSTASRSGGLRGMSKEYFSIIATEVSSPAVGDPFPAMSGRFRWIGSYIPTFPPMERTAASRSTL